MHRAAREPVDDDGVAQGGRRPKARRRRRPWKGTTWPARPARPRRSRTASTSRKYYSSFIGYLPGVRSGDFDFGVAGRSRGRRDITAARWPDRSSAPWRRKWPSTWASRRSNCRSTEEGGKPVMKLAEDHSNREAAGRGRPAGPGDHRHHLRFAAGDAGQFVCRDARRADRRASFRRGGHRPRRGGGRVGAGRRIQSRAPRASRSATRGGPWRWRRRSFTIIPRSS